MKALYEDKSVKEIEDLLGNSKENNRIKDSINKANDEWDDESKKRAIIASRYLNSVGKGENALELALSLIHISWRLLIMSREMKDSGVEWIGEIPKDWKIGRVKNVFIRKNEKARQENPTILSLARSGVKVRDISTGEGQIAESYYNYNPVEIGDLLLNPMAVSYTHLYQVI